MFTSRVVKADWPRKRMPYRTPGIYAHTPKFYQGRVSHVGYACVVFPRTWRLDSIKLWYMGNPFRHKIVEVAKRKKCFRCHKKWACEFYHVLFVEDPRGTSYVYPVCDEHRGRIRATGRPEDFRL